MAQLTKAEMYALMDKWRVTHSDANARNGRPDLDRIMVAGAYAESKWNTHARGDIRADGFECSRSLFQTNLCGGVADHPRFHRQPELLDDPDIQMELMLPRYKQQYDRWTMLGLSGRDRAWRVCAWAELPAGYDNEHSPANQGYRNAYDLVSRDDNGESEDGAEGVMPINQTALDHVVAEGQELYGTPYRINPPPDGVNNLDCSLFIQKAAKNAGMPWPANCRTVEQIRGECHRRGLHPLPWDNVPTGALLFFIHTYEPSEPSQVPDGEVGSHIGFSYGTGSLKMLDCHASNGSSGPPGVTDTYLTEYWQSHLLEARLPWWGVSDVVVSDCPENDALNEQIAELHSYIGAVGHDIIRVAIDLIRAERQKPIEQRDWESVTHTITELLAPHEIRHEGE